MDILFNENPKFRPMLLQPGNLKLLGHENVEKLSDFPPIYPVIEYMNKQYEKQDTFIFLLKSLTGTGKSLALPPFIYAYYRAQKTVVVCEPQISVSKSIATTICKIFPQRFFLGQNIGYKTSDESVEIMSPGIMVVTVGVMVQMLVNTPEEEFGNYIFLVDEVHNVSDNQLYQLFATVYSLIMREIKTFFVFMSADIEFDKFKDMYNQTKPSVLNLDANMAIVEGEKAQLEVSYILKDSQNLIEDTFNQIYDFKITKGQYGDVIVFLEGNAQIKKFDEYIHLNRQKLGSFYVIHASSQNLKMIDGGVHKINNDTSGAFQIILTTPVFQTGITIEGATLVIDTGRGFKSKYNPLYDTESVQLLTVQKSDNNQRVGRVGRVRQGWAVSMFREELLRIMPHNVGWLTMNDPSTYILHLSAETPKMVQKMEIINVDKICFQSLISSMTKLWVSGFCNAKWEITERGLLAQRLISKGISFNESIFIIECAQSLIPVSFSLLFCLLVRERKWHANSVGTDIDSLYLAIRKTTQMCADPVRSIWRGALTTYVEIMEQLKKQNIDTGEISDSFSEEAVYLIYKKMKKVCEKIFVTGRYVFRGGRDFPKFVNSCGQFIQTKNLVGVHLSDAEDLPPVIVVPWMVAAQSGGYTPAFVVRL